MERKKVYFISDIHLGSSLHTKDSIPGKESTVLPIPTLNKNTNYCPNHDIERKVCRWLDKIKHDAAALYLVGDIFDFWFEYKNVVPRGFTRFLGKIAELSDLGVEIHFFIGNHDIWLTDYLAKECGVIVHTEPLVKDIYNKKFFIAHGDGLGDNSKSFKVIRFLFRNNLCRRLFATIHPRWAVSFAHKWSNHSRETGGVVDYLGEDKEHLVLYAKSQLEVAPHINFFVFGHRHIMLDLMIAKASRVIILGDWLNYFSYAVFDGQTMSLEIFEDSSAEH